MVQNTSFYSADELKEIGFKSFGKNVFISRFARFYHPENISIGDNVRIDDFCILSAGSSIKIGSYIHIGCFTSIIGAGEIILSDFCGISGHCCVYSSSDDYTGEFMTNPMVPEEFRCVTSTPVYVGKHVVVGCSSVILPGAIIEDGVSIGAMTLVQKKCAAGYIYAGNPMKKVIKRFDNYKELELQLKNKIQNGN